MIFKKKMKDKVVVSAMVLSMLVASTPINAFGAEKREVVDIPSSSGLYHKELIGKDRYETSNKILKDLGDNQEILIVVNASEIMADGLSASALAGKLKANIVPINPKKVNKNSMAKINKAKEVYLIGGYNAIPKSFEEKLKNKKIIRIGGKDRIETSEKIANYIGKYDKAYLVNGYTGQADAMSISPVAARDVSPIILTKQSSSNTPKKDNVEYTIIGGNKAVSDKVRKRFSSKRIDGKDRYETNRNVLKKFYPNRNSISFCNGETLVDALSGTIYAKDEGIALINRRNNLDLLEYINTSQLGGLPFDLRFVYGSGGTGGSGSSGGSGGTGGSVVIPGEKLNKAPIINSVVANQTGAYNADGSEKVVIKVTANDSDGDTITYKYYEGTKELKEEDYYTVGEHTVTVVVTDSKGASSKKTVTFTVTKENFVTMKGSYFYQKLCSELVNYLEDYEVVFKKVSKEEFENIKNNKTYIEVGKNANDVIAYSEDVNNIKTVYIVSKYNIHLGENCQNMFSSTNVKNIYGFETLNTSKVTNMGWMFSDCKKLESVDLSNFDTSSVEDMRCMFSDCKKLESVDLSNFDTSKVTSMQEMFSGCNNLTGLDVSNFDTSKVTSMQKMFSECHNLTGLDVSNFDTSNVTSTSWMFSGCLNLTNLDVSRFDTSKVKYMQNMFARCLNLTELDLSNFNMSSVTSMQEMFSSCEKIKRIQFASKIDSNVLEDMSNMFNRCYSLEELDLSGFNTSNVKNMGEVFAECKGLKKLNINGFDTSNVIDMGSMFYGCDSLEELDLSGFDTSNVIYMSNMFDGCYSLKILKNNFNMSNVERMDRMFYGCKELKSELRITQNNTDFSGKEYAYRDMFTNCSGNGEFKLYYSKATEDLINKIKTASSNSTNVNYIIDEASNII